MFIWRAGQGDAPKEPSVTVEEIHRPPNLQVVTTAVAYVVASCLIAIGFIGWSLSSDTSHNAGMVFIVLPLAPYAVPALACLGLLKQEFWGAVLALLIVFLPALISIPMRWILKLPRLALQQWAIRVTESGVAFGFAWLTIWATIDFGPGSESEIPPATLLFPFLWPLALWLIRRIP